MVMAVVKLKPTIEAIIAKSKLLESNPGLHPCLAMVLVYKLLFSPNKELQPGNFRVNQVLASKRALKKALEEVEVQQEKVGIDPQEGIF